ncbi:type II toxin-antitoxin system PemK/MazF family toxin [Nocardia sp. 2]|uniref:Type II toxin-antitoxin system PemK/MazF family toxin n=1 Tax=Nocardia acididurans TaxID=2802282 RepID=A0ABS1M4N5_9NOCA|nr:type II toxin-antitoxin system PemK/MazF family toxin [Nocardia acididurans]MBL1075291.1 type II toxin-antitoxin system PemK/MazF family toxin [Nocardia acididurans]
MSHARGEVRAYQALGRIRNVLIISADSANAEGACVCIDVTDVMPISENIALSLSVALGNGLYAKCLNISRVNPGNLRELLFTVDQEVLDSIDRALRRLLNLQ